MHERFLAINRSHTSHWCIQKFPTMLLAIGTMRLAGPTVNVFESCSSWGMKEMVSCAYQGEETWRPFDVNLNQIDVNWRQFKSNWCHLTSIWWEFESNLCQFDVNLNQIGVNWRPFDVNLNQIDVNWRQFDVNFNQIGVIWRQFDVNLNQIVVNWRQFDVNSNVLQKGGAFGSPQGPLRGPEES